MQKKPTITQYYFKYRLWLDNTCTEQTGYEYCWVIEDFLRRFKDKDHQLPDGFHRYDIMDYQEARTAEGIGPRKINYSLAVIRAFWNWMIDRELATVNPASRVRRQKEPETGRKALPLENIRTLLSICETVREQLLVMLPLTCGLRGCELANLRWADIDWENGLMTLSGTTTKNKRNRTLPIREDVMGLLRQHKEISKVEWVLDLSISSIQTYYRRMNVRAGLPNTGLHDLRRSYATYLLRAGADIYTVKDLLGHVNLSTTARYLTAESPEEVRSKLAIFPGEQGSKAVEVTPGSTQYI